MTSASQTRVERIPSARRLEGLRSEMPPQTPSPLGAHYLVLSIAMLAS